MLRTGDKMFKLYKSSKRIMLVVYMIIMNCKHFYNNFTKHFAHKQDGHVHWSAQRISHSDFTCLWSGRHGNAQPESVWQQLWDQCRLCSLLISGSVFSQEVWWVLMCHAGPTPRSHSEALLCERWASVLVIYYMCDAFVQTCCINCRLQVNML